MTPSKHGGIAITGAAGWLGRELFSALQDAEPDSDLLLLGRKSEIISLGTPSMTVHEWDSEILPKSRPQTLVHLAYVTRERIHEFGVERYKEANFFLRMKVESAINEAGIQNLVVASSGAALKSSTDPYAEFKADDEAFYRDLAQRHGINLVIARAWSLTGRYCTKPKEFLIYDVINQLLLGNTIIRLNSSADVWRKYVDAGEYLRCCLSAVMNGWSGEINSAGDLVEASDLVMLAAEALNQPATAVRPNWDPYAAPSLYLSNDSTMDDWFEKLGQPRSPLPTQIESIIQSFKNGAIALQPP